jgi:hypothetical protein
VTITTTGAGQLIGLAADTKPTTYATGTRFFETDTGLTYYWNGTAWLGTSTGTASKPTFFISKSGSTYYSNGVTGSHSNTDAKVEIQWAIDNVPSDGGQILLAPNTTFDLGSAVADGLTITQSGTKRVDFMGSGHTTKIQYTGTGYAIAIAGSTSDSQSFKIGNFIVEGSTKTSGRHGISDASIAPAGYFSDLYIRNMDTALKIENTNSRFIERFRVKTANTGLMTMQGTLSAANGIWLNNFSISNCATVGININTPYAGPTESGGSIISIRGGNIDASLLAIQLSGITQVTQIEDVYIETGTGTFDIYIKGVSNSFPATNITLKNVRASGIANSVANMIKLDFVKKITLDNVRVVSYTDSMIYLNLDTGYELDIRSPVLESTPFLINSVAIANNRNLGTVLERGRIGFIALAANASSIEGDVAVIASTNRYIKAATADNLVPVVIMYGNVATGDRPAVFCMKGITPVNMDAAAAIGDTVTTSATSGKGKTNNSATDPKLVLGHVVKTLASAGLTDVKII